MRVRYHKMYYHFKPGKTYWILYILLRKAGIAFAGLMFRTQPGFQMAVMLLILFVAFVLQVKHQPYMSTAQRELVLAEHDWQPLWLGRFSPIEVLIEIVKRPEVSMLALSASAFSCASTLAFSLASASASAASRAASSASALA